MKLISEEIQDAQYLVEETNGKKSYKIKGIFLQSDLKNRNGRVYPKQVLEQEVSRYNREFINKKRAFGELVSSRWSNCKLRESITHDYFFNTRW